MLISKKSPRPSDRYFAGEDGDFPLRRYMRLREDLGSGAVHAVLTALLLFLVFMLGRSVGLLFHARGDGGSRWAGWGTWLLLAIFALSVTRRLYYKLMELRQIRREMGQMRSRFRQSGDPGCAAGDAEPRRR